MNRGRARRCYRAPLSNGKGLLRFACNSEKENRNKDWEPAKEVLLERSNRQSADMHHSQSQDVRFEGSSQKQETLP